MNYILAGDLGKRHDPATISITERVQVILPPKSLPGTWQFEEERRILCTMLYTRRLEMFELGTPYRAIVTRHKEILQNPRFAGNTDHVVDATGVGEAVAEMFREEGMAPAAVWCTSGNRVVRPDENKMDFNVPKRDIAIALQDWYQNERIKVNPGHNQTKEGIRQAEVFAEYEKQLAKFTEKITKNHNAVYENESDIDHDDLVIAIALTCWWVTTVYGMEEPAPMPESSGNDVTYNALKPVEYHDA